MIEVAMTSSVVGESAIIAASNGFNLQAVREKDELNVLMRF